MPFRGLTELPAVLFLVAVTIALAATCAYWRRSRQSREYEWWAFAWRIYVLRILAGLSFLIYREWSLLYIHQMLAGWSGVLLLAVVWRVRHDGRLAWWFAVLAAFPPAWSYVAIYRIDSFAMAAFPAALFLSATAAGAGLSWWREARSTADRGATIIAWTFAVWAIHHLDYVLLRPRGTWVPWSYLADAGIVIAVGIGLVTSKERKEQQKAEEKLKA